MVYMSLKWAGIVTIVVIIFNNKNILKIIKLKFLKSKCKLSSHCTYQYRHFGAGFNFYKMKFLLLLEKISPEQKLPLFSFIQLIKIADIFRNNGIIILFFSKKFSELPLMDYFLNSFRNCFLKNYQKKYDT